MEKGTVKKEVTEKVKGRKKEKKSEKSSKKITGRDVFVQAANVAAGLNPKITETNEFNKLFEDLAKQGSDEIKYPEILFKHLPLLKDIIYEIVKNQDKLVNTKDKNAKITELTETLQRLQAEFENYKKRIEKEFLERIKYSNAELICKLLPILDSFELAIKNKDKGEDFIKGIELVYSQFHTILKQQGLKPIDTLNKKFNPYLHEVMMQEENNKEDEIVLEEFQKGYMLDNKVLRHSKVKISKKKEKAKEVKEKKEETKKQKDIVKEETKSQKS